MYLDCNVVRTGIFSVCIFFFSGALAQQNNQPIIKITAPIASNTYPLNTLIPYSISVSDKEDGESKYDEINSREVLLTVRFLPDAASVDKARSDASAPDPPGLVLLQKSTCTNCHAFNAPLIGPSFLEITKRDPSTMKNEHAMAESIINGSSGSWGNAVMPSHPDLTLEAARQVVTWIFENVGREDTDYYSGAEGTLRLIAPVGALRRGIFILRASYTDQGFVHQKALQGTDAIIVFGK